MQISNIYNHRKDIIITPRREIKRNITLYKYISKKALEGLIKYGDFRVTYQEDSNDPYDIRPARNISSATNLNKKKTQGFISLTGNKNCAPMWGNYADKHTGALIEFKIPFFDYQKIDNSSEHERQFLKRTADLISRGFKIYYFHAFYDEGRLKYSTNSRYIIKCKYAKDHKRVHTTDICFGNVDPCIVNENDILNTLCTKDWDWRYEKEYRIPIRASRDINKKHKSTKMQFTQILTPFITSVIIGIKNQVTIKSLREKIDYQRAHMANANYYIPENVKIKKASINSDSFQPYYGI